MAAPLHFESNCFDAEAFVESLLADSTPTSAELPPSSGSDVGWGRDCFSTLASIGAASCQTGSVMSFHRRTSPDRSTAASSDSPESVHREVLPHVTSPFGLTAPPGLENKVKRNCFERTCAEQNITLSQLNCHPLLGEASGHQLPSALATPPSFPPSFIAWAQQLPPPPACAAALPPCLPPPEVPATDGMSPSGHCAPSWFAVGAEVEIVGLTKMPAFNGLKAIVQGREEASGRYNVLFELRDASGPRLAAIKGENLLSSREALLALAALSSETCFPIQADGIRRIA